MNGTGIAMLFSAGTFLYVATVHILPDLKHSYRLSNVEDGKSNGLECEEQFSKTDLCFLVGGILLPIFFSAFHHH